MEEKKSYSTRVCITGGSGFIGSWLVKKLLEKGHTVHVTLRSQGLSLSLSQRVSSKTIANRDFWHLEFFGNPKP